MALVRLASLLPLLVLGPRAEVEDPKPAPTARPAPAQSRLEGSGSEFVPRPRDDDVHTAIERGLRFLASEQKSNQDGSFPTSGGKSHAPVALAALGSLAFMASGSTPERGPWGREVALAIDYLLSKAQMSSADERGYIAVSLDDQFGMHGHGYATLALAQAYTVAPSSARGQRIAEVLEAATKLIESSQTVEGGWFYKPIAGLDHENSVTVVQLQALRAARSCGMQVDSAVIAKAIEYIRRCQNDDGHFRYALDPTQKKTLALTAAGLATLQNAGRYEGPEVSRAVQAMWRDLIARDQGGADPELYANDVTTREYERLYVALALWTHPDRQLFARWSAEERTRVLHEQREDGGWPNSQFGACYATAMNCLFLSIEDELLPLFER